MVLLTLGFEQLQGAQVSNPDRCSDTKCIDTFSVIDVRSGSIYFHLDTQYYGVASLM